MPEQIRCIILRLSAKGRDSGEKGRSRQTLNRFAGMLVIAVSSKVLSNIDSAAPVTPANRFSGMLVIVVFEKVFLQKRQIFLYMQVKICYNSFRNIPALSSAG